ncbi:MAG: hypothetical protein KAJ19_25580 [Gammaproteobacteria bacterium]|nr:hypothetical protein [Gammaproteobacteria bacterium]
MIEYRALFLKAVAGDPARVTCDNSTDANNLRQKFYRYRDKLRDSDDELNLIADNFQFELDGCELVISYNNPENLLEALNDDEKSGGPPLNPKQQDQSSSGQRPPSKGSR